MATVAEQLLDARAAYHELVTGRAPRVVLDQNGEKVEFAATNTQKLYAYILSLERLTSSPVGTPSGPAGFLF